MDPEHIEPVQSLALGRRSRARTAGAVAIPVVLLVGVVGAAMLGEIEAPVDNATPGIVAAASEPPPEPSVAPEVAALESAGFPTRALGLPVQSVASTIERHTNGEIRDEVVAVAGWLSVPPEPDCGTDVVDERGGLYGTGAACTRGTVLTDDAEPVVAVRRSGEIRHLRLPRAFLSPVGLPGPSLATIAAQQRAPDNVILPERAVVLGRFADGRLEECRASTPDCGATFAIERVAWVDGSWRLRRPLIYPAAVEPVPSGMVRWPTVDRAIRRGAIILSESILPRADLATVDPAADAATPGNVETIWYVRLLLRPDGIEDSRGEIGWAVIDDDTAAVLASDPERVTEEAPREPPSTGASAPPADEPVIPATMFGLDVLGVDDARALAGDALDSTELVAVEGWLSVAPDRPECAELPVIACPRQGSLSRTQEPGEPMIGVETRAGTPLLGLTRQSPSLRTWTVPNRVALVGRLRFAPGWPCAEFLPCDTVLTVERLAWLRTAARERPVLTMPGSLDAISSREEAEDGARDAIDGVGATLLFALIDHPRLQLLDPDAAAAVKQTAAGHALWYLRAFARPTGSAPEDAPIVGWSVVDDATQEVVASGLWTEAP